MTADQLTSAAERLTLNIVIFADLEADKVILVRLEDDDADRATSDAAARGYLYAGCIAVNAGTPKVLIEPGYEAAIFRAGIVIAEMLGTQLKRLQQEENVCPTRTSRLSQKLKG